MLSRTRLSLSGSVFVGQVSNQSRVVCRTQKVVPVRVMASFKASTVLSESAVEPPPMDPSFGIWVLNVGMQREC